MMKHHPRIQADRHERVLATVLVAVLVAILVSPGFAQTSQRTTPPSQPSLKQARPKRPPIAKGSQAAIALAEKVIAYAGGKAAWQRVENLVFSYRDPSGTRWHFWDRKTGKVRIEQFWRSRARHMASAGAIYVYDVEKDKAVMLHGPGTMAATATDTAGSMWNTSGEIMLLPLQVLDSGAVLTVLPKGKAAGASRLKVTYDNDTGKYPNRNYILHVEAATGKLLSAEVQLLLKYPHVTAHYKGYKKCGSLRLSLKRGWGGSDQTTSAGNVRINVKAPKDIFTDDSALIESLREQKPRKNRTRDETKKQKSQTKESRKKEKEQEKEKEKEKENQEPTAGSPTPKLEQAKQGGDPRKVDFVLPFDKALARAKATGRLLFVKPIQGGVDAAGAKDYRCGTW